MSDGNTTAGRVCEIERKRMGEETVRVVESDEVRVTEREREIVI
jgi:hypothetical protein